MRVHELLHRLELQTVSALAAHLQPLGPVVPHLLVLPLLRLVQLPNRLLEPAQLDLPLGVAGLARPVRARLARRLRLRNRLRLSRVFDFLFAVVDDALQKELVLLLELFDFGDQFQLFEMEGFEVLLPALDELLVVLRQFLALLHRARGLEEGLFVAVFELLVHSLGLGLQVDDQVYELLEDPVQDFVELAEELLRVAQNARVSLFFERKLVEELLHQFEEYWSYGRGY